MPTCLPSRIPNTMTLVALLVWLGGVSPARAQRARVVDGPVETREALSSSIWTRTVSTDTVVDLLTKDGDWSWVILEDDVYGTNRSVWIRTEHLELLEDPAPTSEAPSSLGLPGSTGTVATEPDPVRRWREFDSPRREVARGTVVDILREEEGWYWIVLPPDIYGTRRTGWIRTTEVERK